MAAVGSWNGLEFLASVDGSFGLFPPVQVLFLAGRLEVTGLLVLQRPEQTVELGLHRGKVVYVEGLDGLLSPTGVGTMGQQLGAAIAGGQPPDQAMTAAAEAVGRWLGALAGQAEGQIRYRVWAPPPRSMPLPGSLIRILITGLRVARPDASLPGLWSGRMDLSLELAIPEDSPEDRWGLDAHALRLLKLAPRARSPEILLDLAGGGDSLRRLESFRAMDTLTCLGLLRQAQGHVATSQPRQPPAPFGTRPASPPAPPVVDLRSSSPRPVPPAAPEEPALPSRAPGAPPRANRSIPPPAAEQDPAVKKLFDALEAVKQAHPVEILEMTDKKRVGEDEISAAFRDVSRRSHPDRFPDQPAKGMAEELFGKINAAYELLKTAGGMSDANRYLQARAAGQPYVPERDHLTARVAFRKAEMLVRNHDWPGAAPLLEEAFRLDPVTWPHALYWHQARYYTRRSPGMPVIHDLEAVLKTMDPGPAPENLWDKEKGPAPSVVMRFQRFAEAAAALGNILKLEGKAAESLTTYKRALAADPENRDAQRELRLTELRAGAAPEKDWLGKLFKR